MAFFRTCPRCGANLDPGEQCDCETVERSREEFYSRHIRANPKTGQFTFLTEKEREEVRI